MSYEWLLYARLPNIRWGMLLQKHRDIQMEAVSRWVDESTVFKGRRKCDLKSHLGL